MGDLMKDTTEFYLSWTLQNKLSYFPKGDINHLMTGHKGNSEFCFPETLNVPRGEAEWNIEVEGKQNSLFPKGPVIKCFVTPSDSKNDLLDAIAYTGCTRTD